MLRKVRLSGELGKKFGNVHSFHVNTPAEAIRALCANFPEFKKDLSTSHERNIGYKVMNGSFELENTQQALDPASGEILIVPVIMGAGATARILIGVALIAVGVVAYAFPEFGGAAVAPYIIGAGVSLALGGVIELLSPVPKIKGPEERPENKPSYIFNGAVNTTNQGHPVPLGYGRVLVGGGIISAGISIDQIMAGYKKVLIPRTATVTATGSSEGNYLTTPPAKWYRRELISFTREDANGPNNPDRNIWIWKFYYYETVLELVEV
jgi:predicted phage tail protein